MPAESGLAAAVQSLTGSQFFLDYDFQCTNVSNFVVWYRTDFAALDRDEMASLGAEMVRLPAVSVDVFDGTLGAIGEDCPFSLSPRLILGLLVLTGVCFVVFGVLFMWYGGEAALAVSAMGHLHRLVPSLNERKPALNSLLPMLSEFVHPTGSTSLETAGAVSRGLPPACVG